MFDKKDAMKQEVKRNIRSLLILIIVVSILYKEWSIIRLLNINMPERMAWALEFGAYSAICSIIFSIISYCVIIRKLFIRIEIINQKEKLGSITLNDESYERINIKIDVEGKKKNVPSEIKIVFPYWLDIQLEPKPYIREEVERNICYIDINYLIRNKDKIKLTEYVPIDLIKNTDEKNQERVNATIELGIRNKLFKIDYKSKGIDIQVE